MSKFKTIGVKLICDVCGEDYRTTEGFVSYNGDEDGSQIRMEAENNGWVEIQGQDFCPECCKIGKDHNYHIKDGRVYDWDTEKLMEGCKQ